MDQPLIPGIAFTFGGRVLQIPPLSLGDLEALQQRLDELPTLEATNPKAVATVLDATTAALQRNYPQLTRADVGRLVDVGNMLDVMQAVMDVAGVHRRGLEADRGNLQGLEGSTGGPSTPA